MVYVFCLLLMDWKTRDLSLTALANVSIYISTKLLNAGKQRKIPEMWELSFSSWAPPLVSSAGGDPKNGNLQMAFCILKMSFQSTSVPPDSKTNLFEKKQNRTPRVCNGVDASQVAFASEPLLVPSQHTSVLLGQLYPGQDKSHALCDWRSSIRLESCWTHQSVSMLMGFSAVCFHVLHHQAHIIAIYLSALF